MRRLQILSSLLIATALIVSTLGFSVSRHYCLGMLAEESYYHLGSESCGMDHNEDGCDEGGSHFSKQCCDDQNLSIPGLQVQERLESTQADHDQLPEVPSVPAGVLTADIDWHIEPALSSSGPPLEPIHPENAKLLIRYQRFLI